MIDLLDALNVAMDAAVPALCLAAGSFYLGASIGWVKGWRACNRAWFPFALRMTMRDHGRLTAPKTEGGTP